MESIDLNDTIIPTDFIRVIKETALDRLVDYRNTSQESRADSETARAVDSTAHAHQAALALEIDAHVGVTNIHVLNHTYAICHVFDGAAQYIHLQIANVLHHLNRSIRT